MTRGKKYNPAEIESKWQMKWEGDGLHNSDIDYAKDKYYALTMLPYPSGDLHIGHWYAMTPADARARYLRMQGYNVLFPMGYDAFGLPAENAAIKRNIHPKEWTYDNVDQMRRQMKSMGTIFDWRREMISSDPEYYRWTQWFFTTLHKNGLAYRKGAPVDWCPNCNTTLAREQVWGEDRHCERCNTPVTKKNLEQWFFRTTKYAQELLDFSKIDWPEHVKTLQENWIGRSEGASVLFRTEQGDQLEVFTTRADTLWGATFMVLAPEHPLVQKITTTERKDKVEDYLDQAMRQSDLQRESIDKEKTGVFTGGYAINPVNNQRIPIWIADYVLMTYGTGAIMAVPAHDERDFEFALKFGLEIIPVIERPDGLIKSQVAKSSLQEGFRQALRKKELPFDENDNSYSFVLSEDTLDWYRAIIEEYLMPDSWVEVIGARWVFIFPESVIEWDSVKSGRKILERCQENDSSLTGVRTLMELLWQREFYRDALYHDEYGTMINSAEFNATEGDVACQKVAEWLEEKVIGKATVSYRLRDWLISRQRYWGAPIPIVYCPQHGAVDVPDDQLPIELPDDVEWKPTGESPLKLHKTWKQTTCPICGKPAERETDTMDTFMCSSWYHLRYLSPHYDKAPFNPEEYDYWMPVDTYSGGIEHATMHLIYTRFFHKACRDMGITKGSEPMIQLRNQGIILGEDSEKMSKSRGNVVSPDELVDQYGADTVRAYLMFFARWELGGPWNSSGIEGTARWLRRAWSLVMGHNEGSAVENKYNQKDIRNLLRKVHQTLRQVTHDFENFEFNTIVSALMELLNYMYEARDIGLGGTAEYGEAVDIYLRMMAPVTPHIAEELWSQLGKTYSIHDQPWPEVDKMALKEEEITLIVQVNGKLRDRINVPAGIDEEEAKSIALKSQMIQKYVQGKQVRKVIYVPGRLVNIVV